ncbi:MAG: OmpA family protein [Brumimicrobium sp.]
MTKNIGFLLVLVTFFFYGCATAQTGYSTKNKKAIKLFKEAQEWPRKNLNYQTNRPDFEGAIKLLEKALGRDNNFLEAHQMIGEMYMYVGENKKAVEHFKRSLEIRPSAHLNGQLYLDIGELQLKNAEFEDAKKYFNMVLDGSVRNPPQNVVQLSQELKKTAELNIEARKNPMDINPVNIGKGVNTERPEYFPTITVDGKTLLFTREIEFERSQGNRGQEDFFISQLTEDGVWGQAVPMPKNINTKLNEGAPTFSADGRTVVFVACADVTGFNYGPNREGKGSCDLFVTERIGDTWTDPINLPGEVNTPTWESQPSLSADGKTLYFIRQVGPRERQRTDIFMSEKQADGTWGKAIRLPDNINTSHRETSVQIHPDGQTLYFTSDGHPGLGGTDIFMSRKDPLGNWGNPINLGYPINTENNENSLLVGPNGEIAFFASDRKGGFGDLDIYHFRMPEELRPIKTTYFEGIVFDAITKKPLRGNFELIDIQTGEQVVRSTADAVTGEFLLALPTGKEYVLNVSHNGYTFFSQNFNMKKGNNEAVQMDVPMIPITSDNPVLLANVFFDLDKSSLRKESYVELNKLVDFLRNNPQIKIEIGGHTDSRGNESHNQTLSENRAKSVFDYLVENGINASRLSYKGYGSTKPIQTEETIGAMTSEEAKEKAHQENRRTEYRIVK